MIKVPLRGAETCAERRTPYEERDTLRGDGPVTMEAEIGVKELQGILGTPETKRKAWNRFDSSLQKDGRPADSLLQTTNLQNYDRIISVVLSYQFWYHNSTWHILRA